MKGVPSAVFITSGFKNFHMTSAAAEAYRRGRLAGLLCGFYPYDTIISLFGPRLIKNSVKIRKFVGRKVDVDDKYVYSAVFADVFAEMHILLKSISVNFPVDKIFNHLSLILFVRKAKKILRRNSSRIGIYHFRAAYGLSSVRYAEAMGIRTLCDHSIVHPQMLDGLITANGCLADAPITEPKQLWAQYALRDINSAQYVLVNSEFVKHTFERIGWDPDRIFVVSQGVDEAFLAKIPVSRKCRPSSNLRFLFAGYFTERKGASILLDALWKLPSTGWSLVIAGTIDPALAKPLQAAEQSLPIRYVGNLDRATLAQEMSEADVFVFPTWIEGSARVVFEAMACGCYVITTDNAGSVVKDGVHGTLIPAGNVDALKHAMEAALSSDQIDVVGAENAQIVKQFYTQDTYGRQLEAVYDRILSDRP
ncbi:glycosyltransferase family 4 protein [Prosthecomicrobium hirschii]|uniref:glycosyltransferase family 4 protein n=1 Tax=Prosthecodimorpha hirschii TaxID=665126 RepID=UPI000ABF6871|nr:glycosyltransferase family 4 protein [Prosthecomicrobium hirschii]